MGQRPRPGITRESGGEQQMRDQEVLRANRELAAYFKGRRTEREARAALKIIKAFIRDRERRDARSRPPLPGADAAKTPKDAKTPKGVAKPRNLRDGGEHRGRRRRSSRHESSTSSRSSKSVTVSVEPPANPEPPQSSETDERTPE
jgi:hypothetical protein